MSTVLASAVAEWRSWLAQHGQSEKEAWLVIHHKASGVPSLRYPEAIEQALCFGWIDGLHRKRDAGSSQLRFTPRRVSSTWSAVNRQRAERMIEEGLMTANGQAMIDPAKARGTWQVLADGDAVPDDLRALLGLDETASGNFAAFPPSSKRRILEWIATAKKPETRQRRISQTVELAAVNIRANHPGAAGGGGGVPASVRVPETVTSRRTVRN